MRDDNFEGKASKYSTAAPPRAENIGDFNRMYIHAFLFRWVEGITEEQKKHVKKEILALQGKIPGLLETHVGTNVSPRGQDYTFGGVMKFVDRAALDAYFPHPVHQALGEWLMPLIEPLELDFDAASSTKKYSD